MKMNGRLSNSTAKRLCYWLATVTVVILSTASASAEKPPERISVAYCNDCVPFQFSDEDGQPAGMIIDLWRLWSEKTGTAIDFRAAPWDETLAMVGSGAADAHAGLFFNQERDKFLEYGAALTKTDTHYFYHAALPPISVIDDLSAYRVGVIEGDFVEGYLEERLPKGSVLPFPDYDAIISALSASSLRVFAADTPTGLYYLENNGLLSEFTFVSEKPLYQNDWFVAVQEGNTALIETINRGMALIADDERRGIDRRWIASAGDMKGDLLVIGIDRAYAPLTFVNALGRPSGLFVDVWRSWAEETGRKIQFQATDWSGTLNGLRAGESDIHSGLSFSKERGAWIDYSSQIYETYTRVYYRIGNHLPADIGVYDDRIIGVWSNTYQEAELRKAHPKVKTRSYGTNQELIDALLKEDIDAIVQEEQLMEAELDRLGLRSEITSRPERFFPSTIHAGILKGNPELLVQINDGLAAISDKQLADLESRWIPNPENHFYKADTESLILSAEEETWLDAHPVTNIAVTTFIAPIDIVDDEGHYTGFNADLIGMLNKRLAINIVPVFFNEWHDVVESAISGKVDGALSFSRTPERDKHMLFTKPYSYDPIVTIVRGEDKRIIQKEDIAGKRVSAVQGLAFIELVRSAVGETGVVVEFDNETEALNALAAGEVDAHISSLIMYGNAQKKEFVPNLRIAVRQNLEGGSQRIAIHKSRPYLFSILQKGLNSISRTELSEMRERWLSPTPRQKAERRISLTDEERNWLASHPKINLGIDPAWAPFEFADGDGTYSGISSGYVAAIEERLGAEMNPVPGLTWSQILEKVKRGEIDVLPAIVRSGEREKYLNFTDPYISFPIVIATRNDAQFISNLNDLKGLRVAVVKDYYIEEVLTRDYPDLDMIPYSSMDEGLQVLDAGEVDAFVDSLGAISYEITRSSLGNVKIAAPTELTFELAMGIRKDWPELVAILNKALGDISDKEKAAIRNTWMAFEVKFGLDLKTILIWAVPIGFSVVLIILIGFAWNRRLSVEVNERKEKEQLIQLGAKISQSLTIGGTLRKTLKSITDALVEDLNVVFARIWVVDETENVLRLQASSGLYTHIKGAHEFLPIGGDTKISRVVYEKRPQMSNSIQDSSYVNDKDWAKEQGLKAFAGIPMVVEDRSVGALVVFSRKAIQEDTIHTILSIADSVAVAIERNHAEETVRESEERNRMMLDSAGAGIFGVDLEGRISFINPAATGMLQYSEEELVDQIAHKLIHHSYPDGSPYPVENCPIYPAYTKGVAGHERNDVLWRKDGTSFPVAYNATPTRRNDEVVGAMVTFMDISEQREAEDATQKQLKELTTARLSMLNMMEDLEDTRKESEDQNVELQSEVTERKKAEDELRQNMEDLERFSDMAVGREEKMIQLKEEINELLIQSGRGEKYTIV